MGLAWDILRFAIVLPLSRRWQRFRDVLRSCRAFACLSGGTLPAIKFLVRRERWFRCSDCGRLCHTEATPCYYSAEGKTNRIVGICMKCWAAKKEKW